mmetsp:Transcript_505/g.1427  ORF Transcript_505/g.1427 Transcript_505/m.1427 type:complete len:93 (-) Transcript_505:373-651(-)
MALVSTERGLSVWLLCQESRNLRRVVGWPTAHMQQHDRSTTRKAQDTGNHKKASTQDIARKIHIRRWTEKSGAWASTRIEYSYGTALDELFV